MRRFTLGFTLCLGLLLIFGATSAQAQYSMTTLNSNQGTVVHNPDPLLVNGWGLVSSPTSPFWVSDEGSGWSTLYNAQGVKQGLVVSIPTAGGNGPGMPTGIVWNGSTDFQINGNNAPFIFATLDGTIAGWSPAVNLNSAITEAKVTGASYTGLAISAHASGNMLYAADLANNKVDVFNGSYQWVMSFTDTSLPAGFAPFGIQDFGGLLYVAFAAQNEGPGGYVDVFAEDGTLLKQVASGSPLNQPWGLAVAPKNFGSLSNTLLVSNNTNSGTVNAFNAVTGQFVGTVKDTNGNAIKINQLWAIVFGSGAPNNGAANSLFFTAGPDNNKAGTFGVIKVAAATTGD